ncbi:MAG: helix-turn-helix domain-containing protein [Nanoarchaeota archaeon]
MEEFKEFGLTQNESKVYSTLIKFGKLSAGETSAKSSVPYGRIYDVLDSLIDKGLVEVVPEKTKKFIPGDPKALEKLLKKRKENLERAEEKVKELKKFDD